MKTRQCTRRDLPKNNPSGHSLHIPVILNGEKQFICDIHYGNQKLCYMENGNGIPVKIADLQLLYHEYHKKLEQDCKVLRKRIEWLKRSGYIDRKNSIAEDQSELDELTSIINL